MKGTPVTYLDDWPPKETPEWKAMSGALIAAGAPRYAFDPVAGIRVGPVSQLGELVKEPKFQDILLEFLPKLTWYHEIEAIVRLVTVKGLTRFTPYLLSLFDMGSHPLDFIWAVGDAIATIDDKESYPKVLRICRDRKLCRGREMLVRVLGRMKTQEAYDALVDLAQEAGPGSVRAFAIEALGRFGDPKAVGFLKKLELNEDMLAMRERITALRRLERVQAKQREKMRISKGEKKKGK